MSGSDDDCNDNKPVIGGIPQPSPEVESSLTPEQREKIAALQSEIEEIWSKKGNYKIDDEAWKTMPAFMSEVSEKDVLENPACAALAHLAYDNLKPEEIAENLKKKGNHNLTLALQPEQVNKVNLARSAYWCYTEALDQKCDDRKMNSLLFANRAQAHIIMSNYGHGLEDSQRSVILDPSYPKSYYRAALCAMKTSKFDLADKFIAQAKNPEGECLKNMQADQITALAKLEGELAEAKQRSLNRENKIKRQVRAGAAEKSNIQRRMQTNGINVSLKMEVSSEQWEQYGRAKPYYEKVDNNEELLHVPMLILWDEVSQSDFLQDVPANACMVDVMAEILPPPWNDAIGDGKYRDPANLVAYFKVDDGVKMPEHYVVELGWEFNEIFRSPKYVLPGFVPTFHIVPRDSKLLRDQIKPKPLIETK